MITQHASLLLLVSTSFLGGFSAADSTATASNSNNSSLRVGSTHHRKLLTLQETYPLPECHGDCDNDNDCASGLLCFHRSGFEAVPGCEGSGTKRTDYCAVRPTENTAWLFGNNGRPRSNFPLGLCSGDCDSDAECQPGLICQQRTGDEPIPGCIGTPATGEDYCRYPDTPSPTKQPTDVVTPPPTTVVTPPPTAVVTPNPTTSNPTNQPTAPTSTLQVVFDGAGDPPSPLGSCMGDCDNDDQCEGSLVCFQRSGNEAVPGCTGSAPSSTDFCAVRATANTLWLKGDNGSPADNFPLANCEDSNSDCQAGLICQQRTGNEAIPGCIGSAEPGEDYCRYPDATSPPTPQPSGATNELEVVFEGIGAPPNPLGACQGDCDNDDECAGTLKCFQRSGNEAVPGCTGSAPSSMDFCAERPTENTAWLMGNNGSPSDNFPLGVCAGDCDSDDECQPGLICQQRTGTEPIPGCIGSPEPGEDYCRYPELTFVGNPAPSPLGVCEGDCDVDADCGPNLECFQRPGTEQVSGCLGTGDSNTDYCALRLTPNTLFLKGNNGSPAENFPLKACEGDCDSNSECGEGLICMQRNGYEPVPGCIGISTFGEDYCYNPNWDAPSPAPGPPPTYAPNEFGATYVPGDLSQPCDGLMLSRGMDCRLLATAGQPVQYDTGGQSTETMHARADGAAVIPHPTDGGWYYTSNSEVGGSGGGVGTLRFNSAGQVIGYKMDLEGTNRNCGGGKTYWDTWVTCEEDGSSGFCWEVDPFTGHTALTNAVIVGGNYESFAYDDQDPDVEARFFTTEDSGNGALVRYTPSAAAFSTGDNYDILTSDGGTHDYLVLNSDGTFEWSTSASAGANSASTYFPNAEGIDVINRQLFFISKVNKELFELDLANMTWQVQSTVSGAFDKQPDQIQKIVGDTDFLYFCEDGGSSSDIHGRNKDGQFFTIVRGDGQGSETTGLAFSPDNKFMYVAFQGQSNIYAFWRTDGLDFGAVKADIKYHQV